MSIIKQVIATTEKRLRAKIEKTQEKIDFDPFSESINIHNDLVELISQPIDDFKEYENKLKALRDREAKNKRDIKRVEKPNYTENLYKVMRDLETQKIDLFRLKFHLT